MSGIKPAANPVPPERGYARISRTPMKTLIIVPTYNESESIVPLAQQIAVLAPSAHLLVVDDNSPDGTAAIANSLFRSANSFANYQVMTRTGPRGLGRALRDGFATAIAQGFELIIQMDADHSHDPRYLPRMIELGQRHDLVIGSRYCPGGALVDWPWQRRLLSRFANRYVRQITGLPFADVTAGFRCWSRQGLLRVDIETVCSEGYAFQVETSYRAIAAGLRWTEMPIVFTDRKGGKSKISRSVLVESMIGPFALRMKRWKPRTKYEECF
jgi:dolichol-phosphate mannosyltransferase